MFLFLERCLKALLVVAGSSLPYRRSEGSCEIWGEHINETSDLPRKVQT